MNSTLDIANAMLILEWVIGGGTGIVLLAQAIKKLFGMDSDKVIHAMVVLVSTFSAIASYLVSFKGLPPMVLTITGPSMYGVSQFLYKTAKYAPEILPRVQTVLAKVSSLLHKQPAAAAAAPSVVPSIDLPPDIASEPAAASTTNEFNA